MAQVLFDELARLHPASFAWALAYTRFDRAEAEDVLQTAYLKILEGRARFDGRSSLKTWLFAVVRRTAIDRHRRRMVATLGLARVWDALVPSPSPLPSDDQGPADPERARVRRALGQLATRQREVLELVFFHDLTVEDAAQVMGVSVGTARVHYHRGKARLLEKLS
jgi:RNA polymerase sigma factor (sigma-70 family)